MELIRVRHGAQETRRLRRRRPGALRDRPARSPSGRRLPCSPSRRCDLHQPVASRRRDSRTSPRYPGAGPGGVRRRRRVHPDAIDYTALQHFKAETYAAAQPPWRTSATRQTSSCSAYALSTPWSPSSPTTSTSAWRCSATPPWSTPGHARYSACHRGRSSTWRMAVSAASCALRPAPASYPASTKRSISCRTHNGARQRPTGGPLRPGPPP